MNQLSPRLLLAAVAAAAALVAFPAQAQLKGIGAATSSSKAGVGSALSGIGAPVALNAAMVTPFSVVFDVSRIFSNDGFGSPINEVYLLDVGAFSTITGVGYFVTIYASNPSWLSEAAFDFSDSGNTTGAALNVGFADEFSGTESYSSFGILSLVDAGLEFQVGADGKLRLEFYESLDDFADEWDALWQSGSLAFEVSPIPEPSTYGLMALGLLGVAAAARRRKAA